MKKFVSLLILAAIIAIFLSPTMASARGLVPCGGESEPRCDLCYLIVGFRNIVVDIFLSLLAWVSLAGIAISGLMYVISAGSEKMITQAKGFLKASLIGFAVVLTAWLMVNVTMRVLAARSDLGIAVTGWNDFSCEHFAGPQPYSPASPQPLQCSTTEVCRCISGTPEPISTCTGGGRQEWTCRGTDGSAINCYLMTPGGACGDIYCECDGGTPGSCNDGITWRCTDTSSGASTDCP